MRRGQILGKYFRQIAGRTAHFLAKRRPEVGRVVTPYSTRITA
jgi:hypothetical protein